MKKHAKDPDELLVAPYSRVIIPDPATGTFTARIAEFPGCIAEGRSLEEAFERLNDAARDWIRAATDLGQAIPAPLEEQTYSGRVMVRFPASVHRRAAQMAEQENTSLNQFIVSAVSERLGTAEAGRLLLDMVERRLAESLPTREERQPTACRNWVVREEGGNARGAPTPRTSSRGKRSPPKK